MGWREEERRRPKPTVSRTPNLSKEDRSLHCRKTEVRFMYHASHRTTWTCRNRSRTPRAGNETGLYTEGRGDFSFFTFFRKDHLTLDDD